MKNITFPKIYFYIIIISITQFLAYPVYSESNIDRSSKIFRKDPQAQYKTEADNFIFIRRLFRDRFYDVAARECVDFLRKYPSSEQASVIHIILGQCHYKKARFAQAVYEFNRVIDKSGATNKDEAIYWLAETYSKAGDYQNALSCLERLI